MGYITGVGSRWAWVFFLVMYELVFLAEVS